MRKGLAAATVAACAALVGAATAAGAPPQGYQPDSAFAQAVSAGANVVSAVSNQPYGWRVGRVVDPFGHHWEIGKPIA